ncbi:MAG: 50S ribosomal protein L20 [Patescibacteria group bacterium]
MPRVKRGVISNKRRRNTLAQAKGYRFGRSKKERPAKEAILHAGSHALAHRRDKKNDFRRLWQIQINAAIRPLGLSYSRFLDLLTKKQIGLNRKMLANLAQTDSDTFAKVVSEAQK